MKRSSSLFRYTAVAAVVSLGLVSHAWAANPFVVKDIQVEGLQRVNAGTVFGSIPLKVGDTYDDEKASSTIRALYGLGLFSDVSIEPRGDNVVVVVQERQTINTVEVSEVDAFDHKTLIEGLEKMGVGAGQPYSKAVEDQAVQSLKRQFETKGYYDTQITTTLSPLEKGRVNVFFDIKEGLSARIRNVNFVGNQAFSESKLRDQMQLDAGNWMSWYTKSDRYAEDRLNTDLATLRQYYLDRGYLEFQITSVQAALSQDKHNIDVTVNVQEGPRYAVSDVKLGAGNWLGKEDEFRSLVSIKPGEIYKQEDVTNTIQAMTDRFGNYGYAFAKVTSEPSVDRANHSVALTLNAAPDQRAYVRNINVKGNAKTRDEVVRREMRQFESSWYNASKVRLSRDRIDRLGYFQEVKVDTLPVPGVPDLADLQVTVKERPTGSVNVGAGYSTSDKVTFTAGISQENIFGSGQSLSAQLDWGKYNRGLTISSTDPYFTSDGVSRTINLYGSRSEPYASQTASSTLYDYVIENVGANINFGVPFSETNTVFFGAGVEYYRLKPGGSTTKPSDVNESTLESLYSYLPGYYSSGMWWKLTPDQYRFYTSNGNKYSGYGIPLTLGWANDSRDSSLSPTRGMYQRLNLAVSPAGEMQYAIGSYRFQYFHPLTKDYTLAFNTDLAYGRGLGGKDFPYFKTMYSGGLGSVRGFQQGSLGPHEIAYNGNTYASGGNKKFNVNLEFVTPFPGARNDKTLRLFGFVDAGQVYSDTSGIYDITDANGNKINANAKKIRASYGVGLRWISPIGPLSLAFGKPLKKYSGDKTQTIQFQIGTSF